MNQIPGPTEVVSLLKSDHNNRTPQKQGECVARSEEVLVILLHRGEFKPR